MLVLMDPLPVAFEEDLHGRPCFAPECDRVALDDVRILRLLYEMRQRSRGRWDGVRENFATVASWKNSRGDQHPAYSKGSHSKSQ